MNIYSRDKNLLIEDISDFDIEDILECGQCFHFKKLGNKEYELIAMGKYLHIRQEQEIKTGKITLIFYNTDMEAYENVWKRYFDMERDYGSIKRSIVKADKRLSIPVAEKNGIRILRQDFFETLISFIISQNKQIPHIKQLVYILSERYGREISIQGNQTVHCFPDVNELHKVSEAELRECKVGFRAPYIRDAVEKVYHGEITEEKLSCVAPARARELLMGIKGVGEKVANCVMLFGLGVTSAFPVDVWMKRIMENMYFDGDTKKELIEKYAMDKFGEYAGFAQQYLFYYGREKGMGK